MPRIQGLSTLVPSLPKQGYLCKKWYSDPAGIFVFGILFTSGCDLLIVPLRSASVFAFYSVSIGGAMRFSDYRHPEKGLASTAASPKPLAARFASIALAAVLAASFMPVAAFADEGSPDNTEGVQNPITSTGGGQQNGQGENDENPQNPNDPIDSDNSDNPSDSDNSEASDGNRPADDEPDSPSADNGSSE